MSVKELSQVGFCVVTIVILGASAVLAQEQAPYTNTEYNEYQKAITEGEDAIIEWINTHPESALKQYALGEYQKLVKGYVDAGKHKETVVAAEKYLNSIDQDTPGLGVVGQGCRSPEGIRNTQPRQGRQGHPSAGRGDRQDETDRPEL